jgi:7,8-dihydropterin-6-yl-methyl-4-(beta-D-ribofuranosyl)aminobenzene 5'-phosphate synthase
MSFGAISSRDGAIAGATGGFSCVGISLAAPLEVPSVDKLGIRVLLDSSSTCTLGGRL